MNGNNKMREQIAITAFGAVTPIGGSYSEIKNSLLNGVSGIKEILKFNTETFTTHHAGVPIEGNIPMFTDKKRTKPQELFYSKLASQRLLEHENFPKSYYSSHRIGCVVGVDEPAADLALCLNMKLKNNQDKNKHVLFQNMVENFRVMDYLNLEPSSLLAEIYKIIPFNGYAITHLGLCSASLQSIAMGVQLLQDNKLDAVIVGGISGKVNPVNLARLELMDVISTDLHLDPEKRSRPFDSKRSGFVLAEGAILFLLEKKSEVKKRGGKILLNILGYGESLGAQHIVAPHLESLEMELAMRRALSNANLEPCNIDYINVHGTSTLLNDKHESMAIHNIFGQEANKIPITANKSLHGHLIASAGAMEILNTYIALNDNFIPGTINLEDQDGECDLNIVTNTTLSTSKIVLKNSFGMGGLAASLVVAGE